MSSFRDTAGKPRPSLRALYFHYLYLLRKARNSVTFNPNRETAYLLQQESCKLDAHTKRVTLMNKHKLDTAENVQQFIDNTENEIAELAIRRMRCRKRIAST